MKPRRRYAIIAVTALAAAGGGAAIAATHDDQGKQAEDAILSDAATRLDVDAGDLHDALSAAEQAQLDQAVKDGKLTQEQADDIKEHMQESGRVLGIPPGPPGPGGPHGPFVGGPLGPEVFDAIAKELGISGDELHSQLESGKTLRQVAKANGKTVADVKSAARTAIEKQLAADVDDGRITKRQAARIRKDMPRILSRLVNGPRHWRRGGPPPPPMGPPPGPPPGY